MKYKVKSLAVTGNGGKIHRSGDIVTAAHFPAGHAHKKHLAGHLVPYHEELVKTVDVPVVIPEEKPPVKIEAAVADEPQTDTAEVKANSKPSEKEKQTAKTEKKAGKK